MPFELSPDPLNAEMTEKLSGIVIGKPETYQGQLKEILSNANIFGIDLFEAGIGEKIETLFCEEISAPGAVRKTIVKKY
jgi:fructuronate reductase